jgi:hypothetical protein
MRNTTRMLGAGFALSALILGVAFAQPPQSAPASGPVEVTYYFLPG